MKAIGTGNYFLNWENCPKEAKLFMHTQRTIRESDYYVQFEPCEWNACIHLSEVSPATFAE